MAINTQLTGDTKMLYAISHKLFQHLMGFFSFCFFLIKINFTISKNRGQGVDDGGEQSAGSDNCIGFEQGETHSAASKL